jgi:thiazolylpeptide-type bacteriocin precursor
VVNDPREPSLHKELEALEAETFEIVDYAGAGLDEFMGDCCSTSSTSTSSTSSTGSTSSSG